MRSVEWDSGHTRGGYPWWGRREISSEERDEVSRLCQRVFEIEQELRRLAMHQSHLADDQVFDLSYGDLVGYGFEVATMTR